MIVKARLEQSHVNTTIYRVYVCLESLACLPIIRLTNIFSRYFMSPRHSTFYYCEHTEHAG